MRRDDAPPASTTTIPAPSDPSIIRREEPAGAWLEALPLGNGRLGAMAWGDPAATRLGLNESTLWSGGIDSAGEHAADADAARAAREKAWELFRTGRVMEAEEALTALCATWCQAFEPVGDLWIRSAEGADGDAASPRELDLTAGLHRIRTAEGDHLSAVSRADEVLWHALPLSDTGALRIDLDSPLVTELREESAGQLDLVLRAPSDNPPGHAPGGPSVRWEEPAMRAAVSVRWQQQDGRALVVCAIVTSFRGLGAPADRPSAEILAEARRQATAALQRGEDELLQRHLAHRAPGADEVEIRLDGGDEPTLLTQLLAYGRYLLASSSRPGRGTANLQGLWNERLRPPWSSNFTTNINAEMNHWPAGVAHVPEAVESLAQLVDLLRERGRDTARRLYGARGWALHHNTDIWGYTEPVDGQTRWSQWALGGLWLETQLDDLARFTGEDPVEIARRRLPARRDAAAFALDMLRAESEEPGARLVTFPSTSPENRWLTEDGSPAALTVASGMDRWLVRSVLSSLVQSAELLSADAADDPLVAEARAALSRVEGPRIGPDGRLLEWDVPLPEEEPEHRHVSHLACVFPGTEVLDPSIEQAAARSLEARGDEATGWSLAWKTSLWARLRSAEHVQTLLEMFLRPAITPEGERSGLYPNLFSAHPPFQMDANFGIVAAVAECLLQSHRGEIELLPTVAPMLASGEVRGLRARPGVEVAMRWADGTPTRVTLAAAGPAGVGIHRVRWGEAALEVEVPRRGAVEVEVETLVAAAAGR